MEFIEQPLPPEDVDGARRAYEKSALPLIADENCVVEEDVDRCAGRFHGINIKLVKCGGLAVARRMVERARELGLKVMAGCMTESTVGISACAAVAAVGLCGHGRCRAVGEGYCDGRAVGAGQVYLSECQRDRCGIDWRAVLVSEVGSICAEARRRRVSRWSFSRRPLPLRETIGFFVRVKRCD